MGEWLPADRGHRFTRCATEGVVGTLSHQAGALALNGWDSFPPFAHVPGYHLYNSLTTDQL